MRSIRSSVWALVLLTCIAGQQTLAQSDPYDALRSFDNQNRVASEAIRAQIVAAGRDAAALARVEARLAAVLADPATTLAGKQEACRLLWPIGTERSVPALARLLAADETADMARYALERNTTPAAARALRVAAAGATGRRLVGIINTIGERRDAAAVPLLRGLVRSRFPEVHDAAVAALGKIGTPAAVAVLRSRPIANPEVAQAMLQAAERLAAAGDRRGALAVFRQLVGPPHAVTTRGAALHRLAGLEGPAAVGAALAAARSGDAYLAPVAARIAGSLAGPAATRACVQVLPALPEAVRTVMLLALADRREPAALPYALQAIRSESEALRLAGIRTAAAIGGARAVPALAEVAGGTRQPDRGVAREALAGMGGRPVEDAIIAAGRTGTPEVRAAMMAVLAERPSPAATGALVQASGGEPASVAAEATRSLGRVGGSAQLPGLFRLLVGGSSEQVREAAQSAFIAAAQRLGERDSAVGQATAAMAAAPADTKTALISVMAELGGDAALRELEAATRSGDEDVKHAAVVALADTWADARPMGTLLGIAREDPSRSLRVQALRGYLRLLAQADRSAAEEKVGKVREALAAAVRPEEKRQALGILRECRTESSIELAASLMDDPALLEEAASTVLYLAAPQRVENRELVAVRGPRATAALDRVIEKATDNNQRELARRLR